MARKRGNSEGSIYQRKDGAWVAAITIGYDAKGRPKRRTLWAKTRKEAAEKLDRLRAEAAGGVIGTGATITVEQLMTEYLAHKAPVWRPRSQQLAEVACRLHIVKHLGKVKLADLDTRRVSLWLRKEGATETARVARNHLMAACRLAQQWGWILRNPVELTEPLPVESRRPKELSAEEIAAIIEEAAQDTTQIGTLTLLLLGLGLRLSEALGVTWARVDLTAGTVEIAQQLGYGKESGYHLAPLKTKSAARTLHLPPFLVEKLARHKSAFPAEESLGLVLYAFHGKPYSSMVANRAVQKLLLRVGLTGVTCHDLRHAHASYLIDANVPITVVSSVLGHANASITMSIYAHKLKNTHAQVAEVMERLRAKEG